MQTFENGDTQARLIYAGRKEATGLCIYVLVDDNADNIAVVTHEEQVLMAITQLSTADENGNVALCPTSAEILRNSVTSCNLDTAPFWHATFIPADADQPAQLLFVNADGEPLLDGDDLPSVSLTRAHARCVLRSMLSFDVALVQYSAQPCLEAIASFALPESMAKLTPAGVESLPGAMRLCDDNGHPLVYVITFWGIENHIDPAGINQILAMLPKSGLPRLRTHNDVLLYNAQASVIGHQRLSTQTPSSMLQ